MSAVMVPFTIPCFAPASNAVHSNPHSSSGGTNDLSYQKEGGDGLDFDLLAEYLLDDVNQPTTSVNFDDACKNIFANINGDSGTNKNGQNPAYISGGSTPTEYDSNEMSVIAASQADPVADTTLLHQKHFGNSTMFPGSGQVLSQPITPGANVVLPGVNRVPVQQFIGGQPKNVVLRGIAPAPTPLPVPHHPHPQAQPHLVPGNMTQVSKRPRTEQRPEKTKRTLDASKPNANKKGKEKRAGHRPRQKSQAQIDRRRERNRILARRTRLRKKFFFESLQKEVMELHKENKALKAIVKTKFKENESKAILDKCKAGDLPTIVKENFAELGLMEGLDQKDFSLVKSLKASQQCFVISDPSLQDNPIVYASDDFLSLIGYSRDEVLGRNCRFLQGPDTDKSKVAKIQKAISEGEDVSVVLLNYRADGTPFWNQLFIAALRDTQNNIVNFIGVVVKVAGPVPEESESKIPDGDDSTADATPSDASDGAACSNMETSSTSADENPSAPVVADTPTSATVGS